MILKYIEKHWDERSHLVSLFTGIFFTIISFLVSKLIFNRTPHLIGITTIFFTVILTTPVLTYILKKEEKIEKKKINFFKKNEAIIDFYLYFFIGTFVIFFIMSMVSPQDVFTKDNFYNIQQSTQDLDINLPPPAKSDFGFLAGIVTNNLYLMSVCFIFSLLFGAGSIFLIVLNSSMAADVISKSIISTSNGNIFGSLICNLSVFSFHFIPEMLGFLIAAIAGGILYTDCYKEKIFSKKFFKVFFSSMKLILISVFLIIISGLIEVYITSKIFLSKFCTNNQYVILIFFIFVILTLIYFESKRKGLKWIKNKKF